MPISNAVVVYRPALETASPLLDNSNILPS